MRAFTSILEQAEKKAVAPVQATMGIVPLIPQSNGKGERPVVFASLWSDEGAKSSGLGCWAGTFLTHGGTELLSAARGSDSAVQRRDCGKDGQGSDRHLLGTAEKLYDSISPLLVEEEMVASGSDPVFLAVSMQFHLAPR